MQNAMRVICVGAALTCAASIAEAQTGPVPDRGMLAPGVELGLMLPNDDDLDAAVAAGVAVDYYLTPRFSVRPSVLFASPQVGQEDDTSLDGTRIGVAGIYNWERGEWHPFAGAGLAWHRQSIEENDRTLAEGTELGVDLLAGFEYFASRHVVVKGEVGYRPAGGLDGWPEPDATTLTLGLKWYP